MAVVAGDPRRWSDWLYRAGEVVGREVRWLGDDTAGPFSTVERLAVSDQRDGPFADQVRGVVRSFKGHLVPWVEHLSRFERTLEELARQAEIAAREPAAAPFDPHAVLAPYRSWPSALALDRGWVAPGGRSATFVWVYPSGPAGWPPSCATNQAGPQPNDNALAAFSDQLQAFFRATNTTAEWRKRMVTANATAAGLGGDERVPLRRYSRRSPPPACRPRRPSRRSGGRLRSGAVFRDTRRRWSPRPPRPPPPSCARQTAAGCSSRRLLCLTRRPDLADARDLIVAAYQVLDQAAVADPASVPAGVRQNLADILRALPVLKAGATDLLADPPRHLDDQPA